MRWPPDETQYGRDTGRGGRRYATDIDVREPRGHDEKDKKGHVDSERVSETAARTPRSFEHDLQQSSFTNNRDREPYSYAIVSAVRR